jgi:hypothetical protein
MLRRPMFWTATSRRVTFMRIMFWRALGKGTPLSIALFFPIVSALLVSPVSLHAQSDSATPARDFIPLLPTPLLPPPHVPLPPTAGPPGYPVHPPGTPPKSPPFSPPGTFGLAQLTRAAGRIFSGTVTAITPHAATGQGLETVSITFHVEQAIRGVVAGQDLTISQWMGTWSSGQRYRIGEHLLLFLYPPSKLGLTSCVGGNLGRFIFDPMNRVLFSAQHVSALRTDPILGGKSRASLNDFSSAVELAQSQVEAQE